MTPSACVCCSSSPPPASCQLTFPCLPYALCLSLCASPLLISPLQPSLRSPLPFPPPRSIASESHFARLCSALPARHRQSRWRLLYSTARHGMSLNTLYRSCQNRKPCVLLVRDMQGHVFGCYTSESWRKHHRYYGDGETFVFQLSPPPGAAYVWDRASEEPNQFFQVSRTGRRKSASVLPEEGMMWCPAHHALSFLVHP